MLVAIVQVRDLQDHSYTIPVFENKYHLLAKMTWKETYFTSLYKQSTGGVKFK